MVGQQAQGSRYVNNTYFGLCGAPGQRHYMIFNIGVELSLLEGRDRI